MDNNSITKALAFATMAHQGQTRKMSWAPYITHPIRVSQTVAKIQRNPDLIAAALLHDVEEDTSHRLSSAYKLINFDFNGVIRELVYELTNVYTKEEFPHLKRRERKQAELERLAKTSYSARLIKLADRLDNVQGFQKDDPKFGKDHYYVQETWDLIEVIADKSLQHSILVDRITGIINV